MLLLFLQEEEVWQIRKIPSHKKKECLAGLRISVPASSRPAKKPFFLFLPGRRMVVGGRCWCQDAARPHTHAHLHLCFIIEDKPYGR
mmetsp:Transcript_36625/g.63889  ORF Transcript_36625/g.63889 Transcript_36625/m.63889 type:complete len:87 (+) Transcript_36625:1-261(+)